MKLILEKWNKFVNEAVAKKGKFTIATRADGKVVLISQEVFDHIGTHDDYGVGSVFAGNITPEMIVSFVEDKAQIADTGGFVKWDMQPAGYELVKPMSWVKENIPDAEYATTKKQDFDPKIGKPRDYPVLMVKTQKPPTDFPADFVSVGIFKYDPARSSADQNKFVDEEPVLKKASDEGRLFALATAFPGGFEIEGLAVPRVSDSTDKGWGGTDPKTANWAVIYPEG